MNRILNIQPLFSEFIPELLEHGNLYISKSYNIAIHKCCCGCNEKVATPLNHEGMIPEFKGWDFTEKNGLVSLEPSIGNSQLPCKSHYYIKENKVIHV